MTHINFDELQELIDLVHNNNEFEDVEETVAFWDGIIDKLKGMQNDLNEAV